MPPKRRVAGVAEDSPEKRIRAAVNEFESSRRAWEKERAEMEKERIKMQEGRTALEVAEGHIVGLTIDKLALQGEKKMLKGRVEELESDLEKEKTENAKLENALGKYRKIKEIMKED